MTFPPDSRCSNLKPTFQYFQQQINDLNESLNETKTIYSQFDPLNINLTLEYCVDTFKEYCIKNQKFWDFGLRLYDINDIKNICSNPENVCLFDLRLIGQLDELKKLATKLNMETDKIQIIYICTN